MRLAHVPARAPGLFQVSYGTGPRWFSLFAGASDLRYSLHTRFRQRPPTLTSLGPAGCQGLLEDPMKRRAATRKTRPSGPTSGLIITKFPKDLRRRIKLQALIADVKMPDWMIAKLHEAVDAAERRR